MSKREFKVGESDFPAPTPAHQAFREKRAAEHCQTSEPYVTADFLAGMRAEHEVAYAMGAIMILEAAMKRHNRENIDNFLTENLESAKEHLAALLEGK